MRACAATRGRSVSAWERTPPPRPAAGAPTPSGSTSSAIVEYRAAWDTQRAHATARRDGAGPDVLMLLEHPSVYTAGKRTRPGDRPTDGTPVVDVDRGGLITWHGPGQLVGYPIVGLATPLDVVDFVRRLEEALIRVPADLGVVGSGRVAGRTGVWLPADDRRPERKIAAIGVRVQGGVTLHGFALNCDPDLGAVRPDRPLRHRRRRGQLARGRARADDHGGRACARPQPGPSWPPSTGCCRWRSTRWRTPGTPAGLDLQLHPALR